MPDKMTILFEEGKSKWIAKYRAIKEWLIKTIGRFLNDIVLINRVAQFCYLFGISGIAGCGIVLALPYLYSEYDDRVTWYLRGFGYFLIFQLMGNWLCMRFVDSSYNPYLHGVMPDGIAVGQNVCKIRAKENQNGNHSSRSRKDATSISMNNGSVMYVATEMPKSEDLPPKRTAYPYFSWTPCLRCNRPRPPRCHHCPICNKCVLKRDHHCFIAGVCIGYRNLRHFIVFLVWAFVGTLFALVHALVWAYYEVFPHTSYADVIFPLAIARALLGYIEWKFAVLIVLGWLCLAYLVWSYAFLEKIKGNLELGRTSFEKDFKMEVLDTRDTWGKLRSVFGNYWMLNFVVPLHFVFEPADDPVIWPYINA